MSTLADGFGEAGVALAPLAAALRRDLLNPAVLQADETPLTVPDTQKGKAKQGDLRAYMSAAGSARKVVVYDCCPGRSGTHARAMLKDRTGALVVDDYGGTRCCSGQREAGCLAHVRRKFLALYKMNGSPGGKEALVNIRYLYQLERTIRQRYAKPLMEKLHAWLTEKEAGTTPDGRRHKAVMHALER